MAAAAGGRSAVGSGRVQHALRGQAWLLLGEAFPGLLQKKSLLRCSGTSKSEQSTATSAAVALAFVNYWIFCPEFSLFSHV